VDRQCSPCDGPAIAAVGGHGLLRFINIKTLRIVTAVVWVVLAGPAGWEALRQTYSALSGHQVEYSFAEARCSGCAEAPRSGRGPGRGRQIDLGQDPSSGVVMEIHEVLCWRTAALSAHKSNHDALCGHRTGLPNTTRWNPRSARVLVQSLVSTAMTVAAPASA